LASVTLQTQHYSQTAHLKTQHIIYTVKFLEAVRLKIYLFTSLSHHRLLVPYPWTAFSDLDTAFRTYYVHRFVLFSYHYFFL